MMNASPDTPLIRNKGFTLIEVLIAFIILSIGLLGVVALQAKAKQASFDSMQRAAALALGNDILQRIRANDVSNANTLYDFDFTSSDTVDLGVNCQNAGCSAGELAAYDKAQWQQAVRARENSGSLDHATVCINPTLVNGAVTSEVNIEVIITWEGRQALNGDDLAGVNCGAATASRRAVMLTSSIHLRS